MDESAQQAVQLGVNVTIFVIALTISVTLLLGVRDVARLAFEYDASIPSGSRTVSVQETNKRIISGNELLSYYANYMTDLNMERTDKFVITIVNGAKVLTEEVRPANDEAVITPITDFTRFLTQKLGNNAFSKDYEVITERYDENDGRLEIKLQAID